MKTFTLIMLFLLSQAAFAQESDTIYYNKRHILTMADFQGKPDVQADSIRSFVSVTLQMRRLKTNVWTGYSTYEAHAIAYKSGSWMKIENDTVMLRYQQYAFKMTELIAQKLEKEVNEAKINARWQNKINKIFERYDQFARQSYRTYETETQFGLNAARRAEWEGMIDRNELKLEIENSRK
jgi:RecA-family ATPase